MYSAYNNKQDDNIQPWHTPFPIWNQSVVPCPVLTVAFWPAYRVLKRQIGGLVFPSLSEFSRVCCDPHSQNFRVVNEAEIVVFLEFPCFFYDPMNVGNLISGSSTFSKSSLYIWKFSVHILLKPSLKDLSITLLACEMSTVVQQFEHSLALTFFGIGMKTDLFQCCGHCLVFQIWWHTGCSTLTASSFRIWNSSAAIRHLLYFSLK